MATIRWTIAVSTDTDELLRQFLAERGAPERGELSRFVEQAVRAHLFDLNASQVKATVKAQFTEHELDTLVDEAVEWARVR